MMLLGFGYHPDNLSRLDLRGNLESRELKGTGFEMGTNFATEG